MAVSTRGSSAKSSGKSRWQWESINMAKRKEVGERTSLSPLLSNSILLSLALDEGKTTKSQHTSGVALPFPQERAGFACFFC
jgi:hypothetical protein